MKILKLLLCPLCLLFTGCASIIHGTKQEVAITSDPPGAMISDGRSTITTPGILTLERKKDHMLTITKPGYQNETVRLGHVISGAVFGNIIFGVGGLIGWGVDAISGAQWRLEPEALSVKLHPAGAKEAIGTTLSPAVSPVEDKLKEMENLKDKKAITKDENKAKQQVALNK